MMRVFVLLMVASVPVWAHAGVWQKCDLSLRVLEKTQNQIHAKVLAVKAQKNVECPVVGDDIVFTPNSKDWQSELPHKRWPRVGQKWTVRYQYLDGYCKHDGNDGPCRIKVYPKLISWRGICQSP